jgi:deoxyxylulose-5-phosphate synthase
MLNFSFSVIRYSNFLKRCFENMYIASVDRLKIIYAGSYSGLCYHTDGASHTSINDTSVMTSLGLAVVDPITPLHTRRLLEWSLRPSVSSSVYFRLRRTPLPEVAVFDDFQPVHDDFNPAAPVVMKRRAQPAAKKVGVIGPAWTRGEIEAPVGSKDMGGWQAAVYTEEQQMRLRVDEHGQSVAEAGGASVCFVVMGTVGLFLALQCVESKTFQNSTICVVSALNVPLSSPHTSSWKSLLSSHSTVICIEDDTGALHRHVCVMCAQLLASAPPKVLSKHVRSSGPSCRTLSDCLRHHGFTVADVQSLYASALS